jgi:hypothetical protein
LRSSHGSPLGVLLKSILIDIIVIESRECWFDIVSLSHFEVLSEVLVSAPPVSVDHRDSLVSSDLMEVGISHIIFLVISWHSSVGVWRIVMLVDLSNVPLPLSNHAFLLFLGDEI